MQNKLNGANAKPPVQGSVQPTSPVNKPIPLPAELLSHVGGGVSSMPHRTW